MNLPEGVVPDQIKDVGLNACFAVEGFFEKACAQVPTLFPNAQISTFTYNESRGSLVLYVTPDVPYGPDIHEKVIAELEKHLMDGTPIPDWTNDERFEGESLEDVDPVISGESHVWRPKDPDAWKNEPE